MLADSIPSYNTVQVTYYVRFYNRWKSCTIFNWEIILIGIPEVTSVLPIITVACTELINVIFVKFSRINKNNT